MGVATLLAQAAITFSVLETQGKYVYSYRVENDAEPKQSITAWDLPVPAFAADDVLGAAALAGESDAIADSAGR